MNEEADDASQWGELKRSILIRLIPRMRSLSTGGGALPRNADGEGDFPEKLNLN